jgi:ACS family glucarate transporter-like MFS transporter
MRYLMICMGTLVAVLLYLDRICLSTAIASVKQDLGISRDQGDLLLGAFFWSYALGQLPAGWLGDRYGARWMLGLFILLWSVSTGLLGFATTLAGVWWLRLSCGLFEAGAYPLAAGIVRRWVPLHSRGVASSFIAVGGRLGGALAPVFTIQLMLWWTFGAEWSDLPQNAEADIRSWRPVMMVYGGAGVVIAGLFVIFFRDWPEEHPLVNEAERRLIEPDRAVACVRPSRSLELPPVWAMIRSLPMWMNCLVQFAANLGWAFLVTSLPVFLKERYGTSQGSTGWLQSLPLAAGIVGLFAGGVFTDRLTRAFGLKWGRSLALAASRLLVVAAFLAVPFAGSDVQAALCLAVVGLATDLGTPACWAFGQDVGGRFVASAVGWANMWGNFGAALAPSFFGMFVTEGSTDWNTAFVMCAAINGLAAVAALGMNASKPLLPPPPATTPPDQPDFPQQ